MHPFPYLYGTIYAQKTSRNQYIWLQVGLKTGQKLYIPKEKDNFQKIINFQLNFQKLTGSYIDDGIWGYFWSMGEKKLIDVYCL